MVKELKLETGWKWIPIWYEQLNGDLIRQQPLKLNDEVDWDLVNEEMENEIPLYLDDGSYDKLNNVIIENKKRKLLWLSKNLGRNDKCFCGSYKKFKKCCMNLIREIK